MTLTIILRLDTYNTAPENGDKDSTQLEFLKWCELMQHWWSMKRLDNIHISSHPTEILK